MAIPPVLLPAPTKRSSELRLRSLRACEGATDYFDFHVEPPRRRSFRARHDTHARPLACLQDEDILPAFSTGLPGEPYDPPGVSLFRRYSFIASSAGSR